VTAASIRARAEAALTELGNSETAVVTALLKAGIRGDHSACGCPIAVYLQRAVPGLLRVAVTPKNISMVFTDAGKPTPVSVTPPVPVVDFVIGFDLGMYPPLAGGGEVR
jgi:hypothetical protein